MSTSEQNYGVKVYPQLFIVGELAIMDTLIPIEQYTKVDEEGAVIGQYTLSEYLALDGNKAFYNFDGSLVLAGLSLRYLELEKDAIEIALGDTFEYTFMGKSELDVFMKTELWTGVSNEPI